MAAADWARGVTFDEPAGRSAPEVSEVARRTTAPTGPAGWPSTPCAGSTATARTPTWSWPSCSAARRLAGRDAAFATELLAGTCRAQGTLRPDHRRGGRAGRSRQPAAGRARPAPAGRPPAPGHAGARARRRGGHGGPGRGHRRAAGHRAGERGAAPGRRRTTSTAGSTGSAEGLDEPLDRLAVRDRASRAGSSTRTPTCCRPAELEPALRANNADAPVTLAVRPGLAEVASCWPPGPSRADTRRTPPAGPATRPTCRPSARAGPASRTRGPSWSPSALGRPPTAPGGPWLDLCAGPGGKTALLAGLADPSRARCWRSRSLRTGRRWCAGPSAPTPTPPAVLVADGTRPGLATRRRSPGCWPTCRAPGWGRCDAGRSRAGGGSRTTSSSCTGCSCALLATAHRQRRDRAG